MQFSRDCAEKILKLSGQFPAVVLTGGRQVGKTTLLKEIFPEYRFITLDLPSHAELAEKHPEEFIRKFPAPVIIDEAQYAPGLFRHLKIWIDQNRRACGRFILTGSQKFTLMNGISESLAGRAAIIEMETLSYGEIAAKKKISDLDLILRGGFPELHRRSDLDHVAFYESYIATYLERDVRTLLKIGDLRDFERFLRACALRGGQLLNKAELARDVGISPPTANDWISVLQASGQIVLLEPWFNNRSKSLVKSPKLYVADCGLLCSLLGIRTRDELTRSPLIGAIWESFVFSELRKRQGAVQGKWDLWYWRDSRGLETDFLVHRGGRFELMEAKFSEHPGSRDVEAMEKVAAALGAKKIDSMQVYCRTPSPYPISEKVTAVSPTPPRKELEKASRR